MSTKRPTAEQVRQVAEELLPADVISNLAALAERCDAIDAALMEPTARVLLRK